MSSDAHTFSLCLLTSCCSNLFNKIPASIPPVIIADNIQPLRESTTAYQSFNISEPPPTSCIICTEDFGGSIMPPGWISLACLHHPSVCCECLAKCIKSDLESKIWSQIKCPECKTLLIYEDIKRLADPETFSRYVQTSSKELMTIELMIK